MRRGYQFDVVSAAQVQQTDIGNGFNGGRANVPERFVVVERESENFSGANQKEQIARFRPVHPVICVTYAPCHGDALFPKSN